MPHELAFAFLNVVVVVATTALRFLRPVSAAARWMANIACFCEHVRTWMQNSI